MAAVPVTAPGTAGTDSLGNNVPEGVGSSPTLLAQSLTEVSRTTTG